MLELRYLLLISTRSWAEYSSIGSVEMREELNSTFVGREGPSLLSSNSSTSEMATLDPKKARPGQY